MINNIYDILAQNAVVWVVGLSYVYSLLGFAGLPF